MKQLAVLLMAICACAGQIDDNLLDASVDVQQFTQAECSEFESFYQLLAPRAFPVEILIDTRISNHNIELVLDAIDAWNDRLGQEVLYATITQDLEGMHEMCNYAILTGDKLIPGSTVGLTTYGSCAADHVDIETRDLHTGSSAEIFTDTLVTQIATHELGHVLGLPHEDLSPGSIMYPTLGGDLRISKQSVCLVQIAIEWSK